MKKGIGKSVGLNGANEKDDVIFIQRALNAHLNCHVQSLEPLKVDGRCGGKTVSAIEIFQQDYAGLKAPDGRVDPNGKTLRTLTMFLPAAFYQTVNETKVPSPSLPVKPAATKVAVPRPAANKNPANKVSSSTDAVIVKGLDHINVVYASDIPTEYRIVSTRAIQIIKMALKECGMKKAVITSTFRTPRRQAEIMYRYASQNLGEQYELYGSVGDAVLNIFKEKNKTSNKEDTISAMESAIVDFLKKGRRTSNHCVTDIEYKKINVLDIGVNSTKNADSKNFNKEKLSSIFNQYAKDKLIAQFIDETAKKNSCWHLEIASTGPDIDALKTSPIITPRKYINE